MWCVSVCSLFSSCPLFFHFLSLFFCLCFVSTWRKSVRDDTANRPFWCVDSCASVVVFCASFVLAYFVPVKPSRVCCTATKFFFFLNAVFPCNRPCQIWPIAAQRFFSTESSRTRFAEPLCFSTKKFQWCNRKKFCSAVVVMSTTGEHFRICVQCLFPPMSSRAVSCKHCSHVQTANFSIQNRRVSWSVNGSAVTSHEMETRSFHMTQAGPLE